MPFDRVLEEEVMSDPDEAIEYEAMDFSPTDQLLVDRAVALAPRAKWIADIGAGNGKISAAVCDRMRLEARVCAVDMSSEMLALARRRKTAEGRVLRIVRGDAKRLPFRDGAFDLVISNSLIHHVPDPADAFREIARLARTGAAVLVRDLIRPNTPQQLDALVAQYAGGWSERQRRLFGDSLRAGLTLDEVRQCLDRCGLADVRVSQITDRHWSAERPAA